MAPHEVLGLILVTVGLTIFWLRRDGGVLALGCALNLAGAVAMWLPELSRLVKRSWHFDPFSQNGMSPTESMLMQKLEIGFYLSLAVLVAVGLLLTVRALLRSR